MATYYHIYVTNNVSPGRLLEIVEDALGLDHDRAPEFSSEHNPSLVGREAPWFLLSSHALDAISAEINEEWLGFKPTAVLEFRIASTDEVWPLTGRILRATSAVLTKVPGDAALTLNYDHGVLIRRNGRVILTDNTDYFNADDAGDVLVPYEFGRVPSAGDAPGP